MRCLFAASEVAGFAKTGGLADVAASLPRALAEHGVDIAVVMPLYRSVRTSAAIRDTGLTFDVPIACWHAQGKIWQSALPDSNVPLFFIDQPDLFDRDDASGRGLYQFVDAGGTMRDYPDNCSRFVFFNRALFEVMRLLPFWPDVLHVNDWHTALAPVYLREYYDRQTSFADRPRYQHIRSVLTIHNVAYQGIFWKHDMPILGLPWRLFTADWLEFHDHLNFLKGGIVFADRVTTVSPTYALEIQTPYYGCGLQGTLRAKHGRLAGIVNGVDYSVWNPATDKYLARNYDLSSFEIGKAECKAALQRRCSLDVRPDVPLLGLISRLAEQKGIDLLAAIVPRLLAEDAQLVVLGTGDPTYHAALAELQRRFPGRMSVTHHLDEPLAHQIEAGADMFLMPSRYEPCGLNQLYSLKYGTVPVVRATGGLADTVVDASPENIAAGRATGFVFRALTPAAFLDACQRAMQVYRTQPERWRSLQRTGIQQDWSWDRSAAEYVALYESVVRAP